jgi:hypothetical protein
MLAMKSLHQSAGPSGCNAMASVAFGSPYHANRGAARPHACQLKLHSTPGPVYNVVMLITDEPLPGWTLALANIPGGTFRMICSSRARG